MVIDMIFALIDKETRAVVNVIAWDGDTNKWQPPAQLDCVFIDQEGVGIGWSYIDGKWIEPVPLIIPDQPTTSGTQEI